MSQEAEKPTLESVMPLVRSMAKRYWSLCGGFVDFDDLIQAGSLGLLEALGRFDPETGIPFPVYARYPILEGICQYLDDASTVRVPKHARAKARKLGQPPPAMTFSLDRQSTDWIDFLVYPSDTAESAQLSSAVVEALNRLPARQRAVLLTRYVGGRAQKDLARESGVTKVSAWRVEKKALTRLRQLLANTSTETGDPVPFEPEVQELLMAGLVHLKQLKRKEKARAKRKRASAKAAAKGRPCST